MSNQFKNELSKAKTQSVNGRILVSAQSSGRQIKAEGEIKYFNSRLHAVNRNLMVAVKELVSKEWSPVALFIGETELPHPKAQIAERGLLAGTMIMQNFLNPRAYKKYAESEAARLEEVKATLPNNNFALGEIIEHGGKDLVRRWTGWPDVVPIISLGGEVASDGSEPALYANSVGYMAAHGYTYMFTDAMRGGSSFFARRQMTNLADRLADDSLQLQATKDSLPGEIS
jgi:hypothetical protein